MVVAQLVERSLPIPESVYRKDENKEKEAGNGPFFKKKNLFVGKDGSNKATGPSFEKMTKPNKIWYI